MVPLTWSLVAGSKSFYVDGLTLNRFGSFVGLLTHPVPSLSFTQRPILWLAPLFWESARPLFVTLQILGVDLDSVDEETVFYQLQNVFGHLLESKLQYYIPEKFWRTFRLFGQPVNVREQQDAFEFFTQIVDQVRWQN